MNPQPTDNPGRLIAQIPSWLSLLLLLWNAYSSWQRVQVGGTPPPPAQVEIHPPKGG